MVFGSFPSAQQNMLERIREEGNGFYAWGAVPGPMNLHNWKLMKPGDYVLCMSSGFVFFGVEEDGEEEIERVPCRRCRPDTR